MARDSEPGNLRKVLELSTISKLPASSAGDGMDVSLVIGCCIDPSEGRVPGDGMLHQSIQIDMVLGVDRSF